MKSDQIDELELFQEAFFIQEVGNEAIKNALENNKKKKIASVFSREGIIYYKLPSGVITQKSPFK
ncbi:MAG: hypothetical protein NE334_05970 [Lentisphaeraceae bacterium]|nr:hypothetical protein [Lentisphaeraceae bacterium]